MTHSFVEKRLGEPAVLSEKNIVEKLTIKSISVLNSLYPSLLHGLGDHADSCLVTGNHRIKVMKKICSLYISIVIHHFWRTQNNKGDKVRSLYSKLILFKNQWLSFLQYIWNIVNIIFIYVGRITTFVINIQNYLRREIRIWKLRITFLII